jgi:hypothetical protein
MPEFIPGLVLNATYYWEAVRPILDRHFPNLAHSAALIGYGSDVLGYDTSVSRDHLWGPRLVLFLAEDQIEGNQTAVLQALREELPLKIRGYSTHFGKPDEADGGTRQLLEIEHGPVDPLISFTTPTRFWRDELGVDPTPDPTAPDWLTFPQQNLLEVTAGRVYHDGLGLEDLRRRFAFYPHDVWLYLMAAQWMLISQEEAFVGRTWQVGDETGSRLVAARLVERLIHLFFLMEKRYAPYSKWLGTAFKGLACYPELGPLLDQVLAAPDFAVRDRMLGDAYSQAARMHNALGVTPPLESAARTYSGWHLLRAGVEQVALDDPRNTRPFQCIFAERFAVAIQSAIRDPQVLDLQPGLGSVNQFLVESSSALQNRDFCRQMGSGLRIS